MILKKNYQLIFYDNLNYGSALFNELLFFSIQKKKNVLNAYLMHKIKNNNCEICWKQQNINLED
jgi:hypothetical protein